MSISLIPESAPFSTEQRAWLNGFLGGLMGMLDGASLGSIGSMDALARLAAAPLALPNSQIPAQPEEVFPWHDSSLPIVERMELAEGKPLARRMMAAMAQLDCGACGYLCKTYSEAIASGAEKNLTLCSPGGGETAKMLRKLSKNRTTNSGSTAQIQQEVARLAPVGTRDNPVTAKVLRADKLNLTESAKDTRHIEIDLSGTELRYLVGDALGVYPVNCDQLVYQIIERLSLAPDTMVQHRGTTKSISIVLSESCCLRQVPIELVEYLADRSESSTFDALKMKLQKFVESESIDDWDLLEFCTEFPDIQVTAQELVDRLSPLRPRLYSIASSQSLFRDAVHLTVGRVEHDLRGRVRKGVASTMFADRLEPNQPLRVFVNPSHGFTTPANHDAPMIMVGPGTGIAPFMAFLQERQFHNALGKNWLFFGDQKRSCDFLYRSQLEKWCTTGLLTRLDTAFSRDEGRKVYVQHRMQENAAELFSWLQAGAYFFVCGDASRMAVDVDRTLHEIIAEQGKLSAGAAREYVAAMAANKRYVRDVY